VLMGFLVSPFTLSLSKGLFHNPLIQFEDVLRQAQHERCFK
jgi:hypothetical protein